MNLPTHSKQVKYVSPIIVRGLNVLGLAILPTAIFFDMNWGAGLGLFFVAAQIALGTYRNHKRERENNRFRLLSPKRISRTFKKIGLLCLGAVPWLFDSIIGTNWEVSTLFFASEVPLLGIGIMMNRNKYLTLYHDAIEYTDWETTITVFWDQVYRIELFPNQLKIFYGEKNYLIVELEWLSLDQRDIVLAKLEQEIEKKQIHTLNKNDKGIITEEHHLANAKSEIWD